MLKVVLIMLCGIGTGCIMRRCHIKLWPWIITVLIWLLLFLLGIEVGSDPHILKSLSKLGVEALVLSLGGIAGSIALAYALWKWIQATTAKGQQGNSNER
ncbi:MAG: LysO family transporter [Prevotella sp.]|jgi:uncharacterized membrane protein YbjE (DUF340 family)